MTDLDRLDSWFESGRLIRPSAETPGSVHLACALAALCEAGNKLDEPSSRIAAAIGEPEHCIMVLADGLGMNLVEGLSPGSFLRSNIAFEMSSVFPSSTAPAITSLATGVWPAQHGALGWFLYLPERNVQAIALPFVERFTGRSLGELDLMLTDIFREGPMLAKYRRPSLVVMPEAIQDSTYTQRIAGGSAISGYDALEDAIDLLIQRVMTGSWRTFTYLYYSRIDSAAHVHGPSSAAVRAEIDALDAGLERLAASLNDRARIVVSADHGQYDVQQDGKLMLNSDSDLMGLLQTPPSGEPRAPLFHVRAGQQAEFARRFRRHFGDHFVLLSADEVEELRLLGPAPLSPLARLRLGDFMALSSQGEALVFQPDQGIADMLGYHGGLEPDEVRIPLIVSK